MVTDEEFWKVQSYLGRKGLPRPQKPREFAYTGSLIRCGECGCSITAEGHTKTNKGDGRIHSWTYYRCTKKKPGAACRQTFIEVQELGRQIKSFLETITGSGETMEWALFNSAMICGTREWPFSAHWGMMGSDEGLPETEEGCTSGSVRQRRQ